jgi:hypothetical protein
MRPRFRRSILPLLGACAAVALQTGGATPARAQSNEVTVRLVAQSAWNGPKRPLSLSFDATNQGTATLDDLSVVVTVLAPATSRSVYELSLRTDATGVLFAYPTPQSGVLGPGETRRFLVRQDLDIPALEGDSALYPLKWSCGRGMSPWRRSERR